MGEAELQTQGDYSRAGRVNTMLARRIELLAEVSVTLPQEIAVSYVIFGGRPITSL